MFLIIVFICAEKIGQGHLRTWLKFPSGNGRVSLIKP